MKVVSLFSGAGGLDLGLIQAGNEIVYANDIDANAVAAKGGASSSAHTERPAG